MPTNKNKTSVIVLCCGGQETNGVSGVSGVNGDSKEGGQAVQEAALTHLQGPGPDVPAAEAGAHTEKRD